MPALLLFLRIFLSLLHSLKERSLKTQKHLKLPKIWGISQTYSTKNKDTKAFLRNKKRIKHNRLIFDKNKVWSLCCRQNHAQGFATTRCCNSQCYFQFRKYIFEWSDIEKLENKSQTKLKVQNDNYNILIKYMLLGLAI